MTEPTNKFEEFVAHCKSSKPIEKAIDEFGAKYEVDLSCLLSSLGDIHKILVSCINNQIVEKQDISNEDKRDVMKIIFDSLRLKGRSKQGDADSVSEKLTNHLVKEFYKKGVELAQSVSTDVMSAKRKNGLVVSL